MAWWKVRKCKLCKTKLPKIGDVASVRIDTADGLYEIEICDSCADFFDDSADIMRKKENESL